MNVDRSADAGLGSSGSRRRALGAGVGLAVVVAAYGPARLVETSRWWAAAATVVVAIVVAEFLPATRRLLPIPGAAPATIVATLGAVGLCVPETDQMAIAALLPLGVVAAELIGRRQVGVEWYAVASASVLWAGVFGTSGRQSALIGALFAWWAVTLLPTVNLVRSVGTRAAAVVVAVIAAVAVVVVARTGGIAETARPAWLAAVVSGAVSFTSALVVVRASSPPRVSARR